MGIWVGLYLIDAAECFLNKLPKREVGGLGVPGQPTGHSPGLSGLGQWVLLCHG